MSDLVPVHFVPMAMCHPCDAGLLARRLCGQWTILTKGDWPADSIGVSLGREAMARSAMPGWRIVGLLGENVTIA